MKVIIFTLLLLLTASLQGCFFFFWIPGGAIQAISDAATGAEGKHCVGETAKIGDRIKLLDTQRTGVVESLSGIAPSFCRNELYPIRAKLRLE